MLKKRLGIESIERDWPYSLKLFFKIPSILIIPKECREIGRWTFIGCEKLKKVIIPESVEYIGYRPFRNCKNATIILKKPKKDFKEIDDWAFEGCKDVEEEVGN